MEPAALQRARLLREWASCAPRFVRHELEGILQFARLSQANKGRVEELLRGLELGVPGTWTCRFPVLTGPRAPEGLDGGVLAVVSTDPGVLPPRGSRPARETLEACVATSGGDLHVVGIPTLDPVLVVGPSGAAAAWLADRARATGRRVPPDVVVSAALVSGPDGEPRLAAVHGGAEKARVVARELPGARLLLCGDAGEESVVTLAPGAPVRELEALVWGSAAAGDRTELTHIGASARAAFDAHDYATAATRYGAVAIASGPDDAELHHEACLRLAAIAVHQGRPADADAWFRKGDELERTLPRSRRGTYAVERVSTLAGRAIDGFRPSEARELLETGVARRASEDPEDSWKQLQVLGAWRRLHLLCGAPNEARAVQRALHEVTVDDPLEHPRVLLDLGFVETRCGDLNAAGEAFRAARHAIPRMPEIYRLQSHAFLAWHLARYAKRGGDLAGLGDLLEAGPLEAMLGDTRLQAAGHWRVAAVRASQPAELEALAAKLTGFQRWYLGVFLLETPETCQVAAKILSSADVDLTGFRTLALARDALRSGSFDPAPFLVHAAY